MKTSDLFLFFAILFMLSMFFLDVQYWLVPGTFSAVLFTFAYRLVKTKA